MKKFRFYLNFDKEERWLNEMAKQGWELDGKYTRYEFHKTLPNNTIIKIDYRNFKSKDNFKNYIMFFLMSPLNQSDIRNYLICGYH